MVMSKTIVKSDEKNKVEGLLCQKLLISNSMFETGRNLSYYQKKRGGDKIRGVGSYLVGPVHSSVFHTRLFIRYWLEIAGM